MNHFFNYTQKVTTLSRSSRFFRHFRHFSYISDSAGRLVLLPVLLIFVIVSGFLLLPDSFYDRETSFGIPSKAPDTAMPTDASQITGSAGIMPADASGIADSAVAEGLSSNDPFTKRLAGQILRLHILADNNTTKDQELKQHVRDAILSYVQPLLSDSASAKESEKILSDALPKLTQIANEVLSDYGANYYASAAISTEFFPIRRYGSLLLPPGEYRALRIVLGRGRGHNWWCMLYPSLCFTEGVTGTISLPEKEKLGQLLDDDDYFRLFSEEQKPRISLRSAELLRKLKKKIKLRVH